jgi:hypothetical protein
LGNGVVMHADWYMLVWWLLPPVTRQPASAGQGLMNTLWQQIMLMLPQPSIAFQQRVAMFVPPGTVLVTVLTTALVTGPQRSVAVGSSNVQASAHSTVLSGAQAMVGGIVSTTVMVWLQNAMFPHRSVAPHVRVAKKVMPHKALVSVSKTITVTLVPSQISFAEGGVKLKCAPHSTRRSGAQVIVGGMVSTTSTAWLQVALLPHASATRQVRMAE